MHYTYPRQRRLGSGETDAGEEGNSPDRLTERGHDGMRRLVLLLKGAVDAYLVHGTGQVTQQKPSVSLCGGFKERDRTRENRGSENN